MYVYVYAHTNLHLRLDEDMSCTVVTYTLSRGEARARLLRVHSIRHLRGPRRRLPGRRVDARSRVAAIVSDHVVRRVLQTN